MGRVGVRRAAAVLLLAAAFVLIGIAAEKDSAATMLAVTGSFLAAVVMTVDIDKLIRRG